MAYLITNTQGTQIAQIDDLTVNTTATSLTLVGRAYKDWGAIIGNNFVRLLENACGPIAPQWGIATPPLTGQLWYDSGNGLLKIYDNANWTSLATQDWVLQFSQSANSAALSGYATQAWVTGQGYTSANQMIKVTGDASGSGTTAITLTLNPNGVTAGKYNNLTVNAKGLVTAVRVLSQGDITSALGFTPIGNHIVTNFVVDGPAGSVRDVQFDTSGLTRWGIGVTSYPETGSNSGSNFTIIRFADTGILIDTPLTINRASGFVSVATMIVSTALTAPTMPVADNSTNVATTAFVKSLNVGGLYSFSTSAPPVTAIPILPGDKLIITVTNANAIPMHVASQPGIYKVTVIITSTNSVNVDVTLKPNDMTYINSFSSFGMACTDQSLTGVGTSGGVWTPITAPPYLASNGIGTTWAVIDTLPYFWHDTFNGPNTSDTGSGMNGTGPWSLEYLISTFTAAKTVKATGGIFGGPAMSFATWNDTTTSWTSLGTIGDNNVNSATGASNATGVVMAGTVVVERLA